MLLGFVAYNIVLFVGAKVYYVRKNAYGFSGRPQKESMLTPTHSSRDKIWKAKTREEKEDYLATTKDKGNRRLDFRFAH